MSSCMALLNPINKGFKIQCGELNFSPWEQQREGGGREKRKGGNEKRKGGKERRKGGKEKKKRKEEKRGKKKRKRGKGKRKRRECRAVSRPGLRRARNCATRGRFPPTLVILRLGGV